MLGPTLKRHINEFRRYVVNRQYDQTETGIYFPRAHATMSGIYTHWVTGYESDTRDDHNIIPDEGLNYFLSVGMKSGSQITTWYCMLHSGTGTPTAAITAANYNATVSEITSGSEGYTEATRVAWSGDAVDTVNTEVVNDTTPAAFTIITASSLAVNGAGLVSVSTKGSTAGTLVSAGKFSATRNLANGDTFNLKYKVDLDAA